MAPDLTFLVGCNRTRRRPRNGACHRLRTCAPATAIVAAASILLGASALADVYKCAGDGGRTVYQEMPCDPGKELRNFQSDPPEITVLPGTPKGAAPAPVAPGGRSKDEAKQGKAKVAPAAGKPVGDAAERSHLRLGMSEAEVMARIGSPDVTSGQKNQQRLRWTWLPADGDPDTITTVTIANGVVTNVERKVVKK
jgi:hypothetical protein